MYNPWYKHFQTDNILRRIQFRMADVNPSWDIRQHSPDTILLRLNEECKPFEQLQLKQNFSTKLTDMVISHKLSESHFNDSHDVTAQSSKKMEIVTFPGEGPVRPSCNNCSWS